MVMVARPPTSKESTTAEPLSSICWLGVRIWELLGHVDQPTMTRPLLEFGVPGEQPSTSLSAVEDIGLPQLVSAGMKSQPTVAPADGLAMSSQIWAAPFVQAQVASIFALSP